MRMHRARMCFDQFHERSLAGVPQALWFHVNDKVDARMFRGRLSASSASQTALLVFERNRQALRAESGGLSSFRMRTNISQNVWLICSFHR